MRVYQARKTTDFNPHSLPCGRPRVPVAIGPRVYYYSSPLHHYTVRVLRLKVCDVESILIMDIANTPVAHCILRLPLRAFNPPRDIAKHS